MPSLDFYDGGRLVRVPRTGLDDTDRNRLADMDPGCEHEWVNGECPECGATDDQ